AIFAIRAGTGTGLEFDCSVRRDGSYDPVHDPADVTVPAGAGQSLAGQPCDVNAALKGQASPVTAQASMQVFKAGLTLLKNYYTTTDPAAAACSPLCMSSALVLFVPGLTASQKSSILALLNIPQA